VDHSDKPDVKVNALVQMADALADAGKMTEALNTYENVMKNYPDSNTMDYVAHRQAIALLKTGKTQAAILAFENFKNNFPKSSLLEDVDII